MSESGIHVLGNGQICAYGEGPDLIQVFGPPYSSPAFYTLRLELDPPAVVDSRREPGTAIWTHQISQEGRQTSEIRDFVDSEFPCLVRTVHSAVPLRFRLEIQAPAQALRNNERMAEAGAQGGLLLEAPAGVYIYHNYPFPRPITHQVVWRGPVELLPAGREQAFELVCHPGETVFYFVSAGDYPATILAAEAVLNTAYHLLLERTRRSWRQFTASRLDHPALLPPDLPQRSALLEAIDSVSVLIKAQQSREGAVLAGHNYHLGYVRDQYGVSRGLLALGHTAEARRILEFYWNIWQHHGRIHNAQAAGVDGVFHVHENDAVEITGYLILQAFDLLEKTGDEDFLRDIFPMLDWAFEAQKRELAGGMLPFNGDETYIAGGILPRSTINDGSAEATLLFLDSGEKLLAWARRNGAWKSDVLEENGLVLAATRRQYRANFWRDGRLRTNNPQRLAVIQPPRFRHGVCERCVEQGTLRGIEWTERSTSGRYLCPRCLARGPYSPATPTFYELRSVSLAPIYFRSTFFDRSELRPLVEEIAGLYQATGRLPSRPDDPHGATVGYDYGLLLYALVELGHPLARLLYEKTLSLLDPAGAWVEYYLDHRPAGTRCRPWESAINIEALLHYAS